MSFARTGLVALCGILGPDGFKKGAGSNGISRLFFLSYQNPTKGKSQ